MNIRSATDSDLNVVLEHLYSVKEYEESLGFTGYADDERFLREVSKYLILLMDSDDHMIIIAEEEGRIIGSLIGAIELAETFYKYPVLGNISFIYIDPEHREAGVAKALVECFEDTMRDNGVDVVYATIHQGNTLPQYKLLHHGWNYQFVQLFREV
jgi:ribosomal protein S18 acetylase RimI-like enzyme